MGREAAISERFAYHGAGHFAEVVKRRRPGAIVTLTSQSATQLHPAQSGALAVIDSRYDVADGAELACNWDPMIPFAGACIEQRIDINVASGGRLAWSDAMMGGREGRGERGPACYASSRTR